MAVLQSRPIDYDLDALVAPTQRNRDRVSDLRT